ncbi:hypothetical protein [Bradyrhizobium sp. STM 3561]|uniref:hypothetical protein n=1 Tax=Bradyrhizobium sp. STM 3561 TaxID=578923 RepID=UPI00388D0BA3
MIKVGNDYVVQANDKCILKVGSRRRAAQLISDATDMLNALAVVESQIPCPRRHHRRVRPRNFLDCPSRFPYQPRRDTSPQREAYYLEG